MPWPDELARSFQRRSLVGEVRQLLVNAVRDAPILSTHDHLRPIEHYAHKMTLFGLIQDTYGALLLRDSDGSPNGLGPSIELEGIETWGRVADLLDRIRLTSVWRLLYAGLRELYELPTVAFTEAAYVDFSESVARKYADPSWLSQVLDRAGVIGVIWDNFWKPGEWVTPDRRFHPSIRIDSSVAAFNKVSRDYVGCNVIQDWEAEFGLQVTSLDDLEGLIAALVKVNVAAGSRSFKAAIAYDRTLLVRPVAKARAEAVFGRPTSKVSPEDRLAFGDYVIGYSLDLAREHGLVYQVHTGTGRVGESSPLNLIPLLERYPDVVFDLFHGGYPWTRESAVLARQYPNVRLNLAWLPNISTEVAVSVLKEWVQAVPQTNRISWGADSKTVEEMYGSVLGVRYVVARALAELVDEDQLTIDEAIDEAHRILWMGGSKIYGVDISSPSPAITNERVSRPTTDRQ